MKNFLSIALLIALLVNLSTFSSIACCPADPCKNTNSCYSKDSCCDNSKSEKDIESKVKSEYYQKLYENQKRENDINRWDRWNRWETNRLFWDQRQRDYQAERDRQELIRLKRNEDERLDREEQRRIQMLEEEKARKDREEQLQIQKFKSEEAKKKIEAANSKIDETFEQIIKANPCMKAAIEDVNSVVYSADQDDVRKAIVKLESEKESLESYKKNLIVNSKSTEDQVQNLDNKLQAIKYELDVLTEYQKSNNEYDIKMTELNNKISEYNQKIKSNENYLNKEITKCNEKVHKSYIISIFTFIAGVVITYFLS